MKPFLFSMLLFSLFASFSYAEETTTECPAMREATERNNPKSATATTRKPEKPKSSTVTGQ